VQTVQRAVQDLKSFDPTTHSVDELIALSVQVDSMGKQYQRFELEVPMWLADVQGKVEHQIRERSREELEMRLKEAEAEERRLMSRDERRDEVKKTAQRLRERLGKPAAGSGS
jgi:3-methyladenine DNA glycosylase/8-oxoguanine DNA glycosylase